MKKNKKEKEIYDDRDIRKHKAKEQPAEEFIGNKADWSKDISEYKRKEE